MSLKTLCTFLLSGVNPALRSVAFPSDKDLIDAEMLAFAREFYREVPFFRQMPLTQAFDLLGIKWVLGVQRKSQYRKECIRLNVELTNPQTKELLEVNILDMHRTC